MFSMCHSITRFQKWFQHYCLPSKVKLSIANLGTVLSQWAKTSNSQCRSVFWITVNLYLYFYNIVRSQSHWLLTLFKKTSHDRCKVLICCLEHADEMHTNANLFCFLFFFFSFFPLQTDYFKECTGYIICKLITFWLSLISRWWWLYAIANE